MKNFIQGLPKLPELECKTTEQGRFYILPSGISVPSVTTILGYFEQAGLEGWRKFVGQKEANTVSHIAKNRGTQFHSEIEAYLKGDKLPKMFPQVKELFDKVKRTVDQYIDNIYYMETQLYSEEYRIAGRVDLVAEFDGKLSVIDFKTSSKPKTRQQIQHYIEQLLAYTIMLPDVVSNNVKQIVCIIANEEEKDAEVFIVEIGLDTIVPLASLINKIIKYQIEVLDKHD